MEKTFTSHETNRFPCFLMIPCYFPPDWWCKMENMMMDKIVPLHTLFCNNMAHFQGIFGVFHWTIFCPFLTIDIFVLFWDLSHLFKPILAPFDPIFNLLFFFQTPKNCPKMSQIFAKKNNCTVLYTESPIFRILLWLRFLNDSKRDFSKVHFLLSIIW